MAESFIGVEVAVIVVTASIVLAGILVGVGRAVGIKRIEQFGIEELLQSIINAAIIGSFAAIIELVGAISSTVVSSACSSGNVVSQLSCTLSSLNSALFQLMQELAKMLNILGYYQSISLDFGAFTVSPFVNLSSIASTFSMQLLAVNWIMILVELNSQITGFIGQSALGLLFPTGLVLRTFFATRKVGGFMVALALGLFVFYPTFVLIFPNPELGVANSTLKIGTITNNSYYAAAPVIDLNDNYALAGKLDLMSGRCNPSDFSYLANITNTTNISLVNSSCYLYLQANNLTNNTITQNQTVDFTGDLTIVAQSNSAAIAKSLLYAVIAPIFSLVITIVFVKELANILGSEIGIKMIAAI